jgi:hypothetical protein
VKLARAGRGSILLLTSIVCTSSAPSADRAVVRKQVWYTPGPATPDMLALFREGRQWAEARDRLAVFKFYQQHLMTPPPPIVEGNTYEALRQLDAFRKLTAGARKKIAVEVGAVKLQYCSDDGSAEAAAVRDTVAVIEAVEAARGRVSYLAMDEPFYSSATLSRCGAPDVEAGAERIINYIRGVKSTYPGVSIGLIEPWPYFPASTIGRLLTILRARGYTMPFFHTDAGVDQMKPGTDFAGEMRYLAEVCAAQGTRFGIIFNGDSPDSNAAYMAGAWRRVQLTADAFADWPDMPQDLIFQSWAQNPTTGEFVTPTNLPEAMSDTHTNLIDRATPMLHGPEHSVARRTD